MRPIDEAERQAAIQAASHVLVEAGAGTGKTTLLVDRVVDGLLNRETPLSRMLLITFMDKAQQEMRDRLDKRLRALSGHPLAERAVADLPRATITTIHGFCHRLLAEFGADFGIPVGFQVLDAVETERLWEEAFRDWVQQDDYVDAILHLLHAGITYPQLTRWARDISRWTRVPEVSGEFPDLGMFIQQYGRDARVLWERAQTDALDQDAGRAQMAQIVREFEWLERVDRREWPRMLAQWTSGLGPKGNKKHWTHPEWLTEQKEWVKNLKEELALLRQQMADAYLKEWVALVSDHFVPYWRRVRHEALALTYDDLLVEAERITRETAVREVLSRRFDLVMVDEFQDTDSLQAAIIRRLVTPPGAERLGDHDPAQLFLVGDPKQSIYRFRGADVETYAAVRRELESAHGQVIPIWQNFRSHPAVLDLVNTWFQGRWPEQPDAERPFIPGFQPLAEAFPRDQRLRVVVDQLAPAGSSQDKRRAEASAIADLIARAVGDAWPVRGDAGERPVSYGDIALVVPQRTGLEIYRQALRARGIPVSSQSGRAFFQQDEIRGLSHLYRVLANPEDPLALAGWLLSPWVAMTHQELVQHQQLGGTWDYRGPAIGYGPVLAWYQRLADWQERFWRADAETVLDWAAAASALQAVLHERGDDPALANLEQFRRLARDLGDRWGIDAFTEWLHQRVRDQAPFEEAPVAQNDAQVTISTVHQAKGLEWPMVIVANWSPKETYLESGVRYNPRLDLAALKQEPWISRDWAILEGDHRLREEAEGDRLLYVALTRAKDYCWFYASFLDPIQDETAESD